MYGCGSCTVTRFNFCKVFAESDENQRMPTSEFDLFVADFLQHEFRREDIDTKYCVMSRGGLPERFPQKLVELCKDTLAVVDFMEICTQIFTPTFRETAGLIFTIQRRADHSPVISTASCAISATTYWLKILPSIKYHKMYGRGIAGACTRRTCIYAMRDRKSVV